MDIIEIIAWIILGGGLIVGVIGVIVEKIRTGKNWVGQGFGRK